MGQIVGIGVSFLIGTGVPSLRSTLTFRMGHSSLLVTGYEAITFWEEQLCTLKLMPDYECYPLWEMQGDGMENVNHENLPISEELKIRLSKWADRYDQTLNWEDPAQSGFTTHRDKKEFTDEGMSIILRLKEELTELFEITSYFP